MNSPSSSKRKAYSVSDKLAAIDRMKSGESQAKVGRAIGTAISTLHGWLKEETKLREFVHSMDESDGLARKRAKTAKDCDLDTTMYEWFVQQQQARVPLSGPILAAQAESFDRRINGADSTRLGWL